MTAYQQARDLITWLRLPGARERIAGADTMAAWLTMLTESCTQEEARETLAAEVEIVKSILKGTG